MNSYISTFSTGESKSTRFNICIIITVTVQKPNLSPLSPIEFSNELDLIAMTHHKAIFNNKSQVATSIQQCNIFLTV